MGLYGAYDTYMSPLVRDWPILLPMVAVYGAVQVTAQWIYPKVFGTAFQKLARDDQNNVIVRTVSVFNGLLMVGSAVCFVTNLRDHGYVLDTDVYREIPYYRFFRVAIVAYFVWDIFVCFAYKWEAQWKVHAFASLVGAYLLSFPYSDQYGSYFTGMFELSNVPFHISSIIRTLRTTAFSSLATICDVVFAFMFLIIRVVGGSVVTFRWLQLMYKLLMDTRSDDKVVVHDEASIIVSMVLLSIIQSLQYVWLFEIMKQGYRRFVVADDSNADDQVSVSKRKKKE
ncbi:hypothetical protein, conserved [Trypanosoma brucei gambiense DAL972]|uniref:TLC domain-containing protein n=1 Tax=Trypanosoma brucei gambiense (strain MHOM/CI/86/DAL972) TaxID=679716 RepID=C9ZX92_TRYB9|nr:hypothetical protein, conserved [Trypanosoma brucei gambiense DAL972]CBH14036.1 hypothetical protein, conserved [Trypanosoma brucei gambiense DAL972]|eukprot:XP_011776307.1 hypothetical protein, conserved [Trypanosoma brucei gambiense DAL972]